jgi:hypothetical protein
MFVVRWFGVVLVVIAVMLIGADLIATLEGTDTFVVRSMDRTLMLVGYDVTPAITAQVPVGLANVMLTIVGLPACAIFGGLGFTLVLLSPTPKQGRRLPAPPPISR